MKSKDADVAGGEQQHRLVPRLRFPEFSEAGEWQKGPLRDFATIVNDRVGDQSCTPLSITSGVGLVTQKEKFGRTIAGKQFKNYVVLRHGDFAYNKSATKGSPQGFIATYSGHEPAAVPNSIFTCFRVQESKLSSSYLSHLFGRNLHGKWLSKYMTVGARAHGSLNIDDEDLLSLPVPQPVGRLALAEQKKIADCLSSIHELIGAESRKLGALKAYKKGLMQQLFPAEGETIPRLRFPEFRDGPDWEQKLLDEIARIGAGTTPLRSEASFFEGGTIPWVKTTDLNNSFLARTEECITALAKAKLNPAHSVLVAMYGGFNQIGRTGYLTVPAATNQAISVLRPSSDDVLSVYLLFWLNAKVDYWKKIASSSRKDPNITGADVGRFPIIYPTTQEQRRIVDCLSVTDAVISAQAARLHSLKSHKNGLMQQLFPVLDEVQG